MKKRLHIRALLIGATVLGMILFAGATAPAAILQTITQQTLNQPVAPGDWTVAIWGSSPAVATAGNDYEVPSGFYLRTPNSTTPTAFAGNSVTIDSGGFLMLKNSANTDAGAAVANVILNGGTIYFNGGGGGTNATIGGTLQVATSSTIQEGVIAPPVNLKVISAISGSGNLNLYQANAGYAIFISGNNSSFSGNWINTGVGNLQVVGGTTNPFGSGQVLVGTNTTLIFNSTNDLAINNLIWGTGSVVKNNTNTVTLNDTNTLTGTVTIRAGVLKIGAGTSFDNFSTISLAGGTLDASLIGGLTLNTNRQTLQCNGTVISNLTATTTNTLSFGLSTTTNDILNVTGSLTLNGNPTLALFLSSYKNSGVYRLINYSGTIQGGGAFTLVPPVGSSETFALNTNTPGQVNLIVTGTPKNLTWVGDGGGNAWDATSLNWSGPTNFSLGDNVTFNDSTANSLVDVAVAVGPGSMTVSNTAQAYQFYDLGITTTGTLTKKGSNMLILANPGNGFNGPIDIEAGTLSIGAGGSFGSLGVPTSITNNGVFQVNMTGGGLGFSSPMSGSGSVVLTGGGASLVLGGTNSYTGLTTIGDGCQLNIGSPSSLGSGNSAIILPNGRLGITSFVGNMTVPQPLTVGGTGLSGAPGAIYANTTGNNITWSGSVTITSDARFRCSTGGPKMNFANTVLGSNVALECSVGGSSADTNALMNFLNTLSLGSGQLTVDGWGTVVLAGSTSCGGTTVNGGALLVNGNLNGGTVTVTSASTIGGSGTIVGSVLVQAGGTLAPGSTGTGTLTLNSSLTLDPASVTVMELNRTNAQNATLLVASSVPFSGTLNVVNVGPALQVGDAFNLFDGSISGVFSATNLPTFGSPSYYWDTTLLQSQGIIKVASNVAPTPTITAPTVTGTNFTLQVAASTSGFNYVLQATPVLAPATWTGIQTNAGTGGTLNFTVPITPGNPQGFFRINVQ